MTDDRYDKVTFRGVTVDKYTRAALLAVEKDLGYELTLWQGSYHKGVSKSAGTHDGGGVVDLNGYYDAVNKVKSLRRHGFVADLRNQPSLSMEIHAVQIGNEKASKSAKAQIAPMERGRAGLARDVPQVIKYAPPGGYKAFAYPGSSATPAPTPTPAKPSIPVLGAPWFTIGTYNTKAPSLTKTGTHKWSKRRAKVVANIVAAHLDVFCGQEMGSGADLAWYDDQLRDRANLKRVKGGSDWRHIWHNPTTSSVVESGHFELTPLFQKDTKEAAWAVLNILGNLALVASMHLEEANGTLPDAIRVKQAANLVAQAKEVADKHDIPVTRWFLCGDTNSTGLVKAEMSKHGLIPASINAHTSANTLFASLNNWIKKAKGGSVDYMFIGKTRPVSLWRMVVDWIASDHNLTYARITLTGKK